MKCCVSSCKMYSDRRFKEMIGVTFHSLPSEASLRNQWIAKIGRKNWNPSKHTKICSDHFNQEDFFKTAKGFRKIKIGATPSLKLDRTGTSEDPLENSTDLHSTNNIINASDPDLVLDTETTPQHNQSPYQQNQAIKLKTIQQRNRRLLKRNATLQQLVRSLQKEPNVSKRDREIKILQKRNLRLQEKNTSLIEIIRALKKYAKKRHGEVLPEPTASASEVCGTSTT